MHSEFTKAMAQSVNTLNSPIYPIADWSGLLYIQVFLLTHRRLN